MTLTKSEWTDCNAFFVDWNFQKCFQRMFAQASELLT